MRGKHFMNKFESPLLPFMTPTKSYKIWEWENISKHDSIGVYVFWDKFVIDTYNEKDRHSYTFQDAPLYIGRADNLGNRVLDHIKGKTHTKHYSSYFHTVDLYELKDAKTMNQEHGNYDAFKQIDKLQAIMKDNNGLNEEAITDFYELFFILLRIPFFNKRSSYFTAGVHNRYGYQDRYINQHRRVWTKSETVDEGGPTVEHFLQKEGIEIDQWYSLEEFINKIISKWHLKNQQKKDYLKEIIRQQVESNSFPKEVIKEVVSDGTFKVAKEYVIFYDYLLNKEEFKDKYKGEFGKW
ncbi:hypothetical protein BAU29_18745 [Bacillus sp. P14-1]|nr:hypothetical protein BAU29_18745 [Bacillus sp. P14-1]PFA30084.1 hypothetical protein CN390_21880 [Bacillus cereus]